MCYREAAKKLAGMKDRRQALEVNRFVKNIYRLYDGRPPEHIERHVDFLLLCVDQSGKSARPSSLTGRRAA